MKVQLNISISIETANQVEEMKKLGIKPSFLFTQIMDGFAKNKYKYPINYEPKSVI